MAWKEYCGEYWLKEFQESTGGCTGRHDITAIMLSLLKTSWEKEKMLIISIFCFSLLPVSLVKTNFNLSVTSILLSASAFKNVVVCKGLTLIILGPYLPTILQNILSLVLPIFSSAIFRENSRYCYGLALSLLSCKNCDIL